MRKSRFFPCGGLTAIFRRKFNLRMAIAPSTNGKSIFYGRPRRAKWFASNCALIWTDFASKSGWKLSQFLPSISQSSDRLFPIGLKFLFNKLVFSVPNFSQTRKLNFGLFPDIFPVQAIEISDAILVTISAKGFDAFWTDFFVAIPDLVLEFAAFGPEFFSTPQNQF